MLKKFNDYYTMEESDGLLKPINDKITSLEEGLSAGMKAESFDELPETGEYGIIYLIPNETGTKDEYLWMGDYYDMIGDTQIDLSQYATLVDLDTKQDKLISGQNIVTVNGASLLNGGDIKLSGLDIVPVSASVEVEPFDTMVNPLTSTSDISFDGLNLYGSVSFNTNNLKEWKTQFSSYIYGQAFNGFNFGNTGENIIYSGGIYNIVSSTNLKNSATYVTGTKYIDFVYDGTTMSWTFRTNTTVTGSGSAKLSLNYYNTVTPTPVTTRIYLENLLYNFASNDVTVLINDVQSTESIYFDDDRSLYYLPLSLDHSTTYKIELRAEYERYVGGAGIEVKGNSIGALVDGTTIKVNDDNKLEVIGGGGSSYELPTASTTVLGGVKIGENLEITADGTLNAIGGGSGGGGESYWEKQETEMGNVLMPVDTDDAVFTPMLLTGGVASPTIMTAQSPDELENVVIIKPAFTDDMNTFYTLNDLLSGEGGGGSATPNYFNVLSIPTIALHLVYGEISSYNIQGNTVVFVTTTYGVDSTGLYYVGQPVTLTKDNVKDQSWVETARLSQAFLSNKKIHLQFMENDRMITNGLTSLCTNNDDVIDGWIWIEFLDDGGDLRVLFTFDELYLTGLDSAMVMVEIINLSTNRTSVQYVTLAQASDIPYHTFTIKGLDNGHTQYLIKFKSMIERGTV